jgi:hypothetical protein
MTTVCPKCGGAMERGFTTAMGLIGGDKSQNQDKRPNIRTAFTAGSFLSLAQPVGVWEIRRQPFGSFAA